MAEDSWWKRIDPIPYQQGWDAGAAGRPRTDCDYFGTGPQAAWNAGYDDAVLSQKEREETT